MTTSTRTIDRFPEIFEDVLAERRRAEDLHNGDAGIETAVDWISLITEELGEASDHANALRWADSRPGMSDGAREYRRSLFRDEMVAVAQLAMSAIAWVDREREGQHGGV